MILPKGANPPRQANKPDMFDPSSYKNERAPVQPQRQQSLSNHSQDEEDEFDFDALIQMQPKQHESGANYMIGSDSYSFLSCSMASIQVNDLLNSSVASLDHSTNNHHDHLNLSVSKLDAPCTPQPRIAPSRGGLRRTKGVMMRSCTNRSPLQQHLRSDCSNFRSLELQTLDREF
ncbi:hypothetical protein MPSEU_000980300 [Mayamaea pseudoterrestris]|nr:hypothetical protein MPSEU_000980300 [Mayamaea pseudoterrestris]